MRGDRGSAVAFEAPVAFGKGETCRLMKHPVRSQSRAIASHRPFFW